MESNRELTAPPRPLSPRHGTESAGLLWIHRRTVRGGVASPAGLPLELNRMTRYALGWNLQQRHQQLLAASPEPARRCWPPAHGAFFRPSGRRSAIAESEAKHGQGENRSESEEHQSHQLNRRRSRQQPRRSLLLSTTTCYSRPQPAEQARLNVGQLRRYFRPCLLGLFQPHRCHQTVTCSTPSCSSNNQSCKPVSSSRSASAVSSLVFLSAGGCQSSVAFSLRCNNNNVQHLISNLRHPEQEHLRFRREQLEFVADF